MWFFACCEQKNAVVIALYAPSLVNGDFSVVFVHFSAGRCGFRGPVQLPCHGAHVDTSNCHCHGYEVSSNCYDQRGKSDIWGL